MNTLTWVLGASGLLGSALVRKLREQHWPLHQVAEPFQWQNAAAVRTQLAREAQTFGGRAAHAGSWIVYWAAGTGSMASQPEELEAERDLLHFLLEALRSHPALAQVSGTIVFASSAGALYSGMRAACYSEKSAISLSTAYARHKMLQEELVQAYVAATPGASAVILRYSTLYGVGQARTKPQGLITQIARKIVANEPAHIYVPLDTIRDYLHADDAASRTLATVRDASQLRGRVTIKIIAAERATSIAELIGVFRRISGRMPRLVTSANSLSARYMRCAEFRSEEPAGMPHPLGRTLLIGIHQVLEAERAHKVRST